MICYHLEVKKNIEAPVSVQRIVGMSAVRLDVFGREHGITAEKSKREALHSIRFLDTVSSKL